MTTKQGLPQLFISLIAIASLFLGVGGIVTYIRLGEVADQPVFVSPYFSAVVIFCGLSLYAARSYSKHGRFWAIIALVAVLLGRSAQWISEAWVHGRGISADFATALIIVGALSALLFQSVLQPPRHRASRREIIIALSGITVSMVISFALIEENILTRQRFAAASANAVTNDLKRNTEQGVVLVNRMSERWSAIDHMPSTTFIHDEFTRYMRDFSFFTGLAFVDELGQVKEQVSRNDVLTRLASTTEHPELDSLLRQVQASGQSRIAVIQMSCCNPKTEVAIAPLAGSILSGWSIVAFIDLADMVRWAMARTNDNGYFRISHEDNVLYQSVDQKPSGMVAAGTITISDRGDADLEFSYLYTASNTSLDTEVRADFVWLAGIIFTFLLIASQRLTEVARKHSIQLSHNALHDPLTGLPNRRILEQVLKQACLRAKRRRRLVSVVFIDLEGIKLINDSIGHDAGDAILIEIARRLKGSSLEETAVTQLGAVEFVLVQVGMSLQQVQDHTQAIIDELSRPYNIDGRVQTMAASAGIVSSNGHVDDPMELVRQADLAMLEAKKEGQNNWHTYTADLSDRVAERLELRNDLQTALETGMLQLHYHPIVEGHSGRVIGVEALTRWLHETRGYVSPARFIPLAEETGQILALTNWTLFTACRDGMRLRERDLPPLPVIVNISPLYFQRTDFVDNVQHALDEAGLPAEYLELEITESVLLENKRSTIQKLTRLKDMGIRISIDDFGTGYSSLSYLKNLPIDKVKIDRSFITDVVDDPADAAITQAIISMAHHLDLQVVAEGVETVPQFAFLRRRNCDAFQGYLFAKPMPYEQLLPMLLQSRCHLFPTRTSPPSPRLRPV